MNRWCPACRKSWPPPRTACPVDLVELVDDLDATIVCRHCGRTCPAYMQSCPSCLGELRPDPTAVADALGDILAAGGRLPRPDGVPPFRDGPSCTLLRLAARGGLVFVNGDGLIEADVHGDDNRAVPPLTCDDVDGTLLFRLDRYEAADDAVVAIDVDGAPLGTYLRSGRNLVVRDETSAPVATLRADGGGWSLVETGGGVLGTAGSTDATLDGWVDDQWWFQAGEAPLPLRPLAAVAMVLATKVLFGRPFPVDVRPPERGPDLDLGFSLDLE